MVPEPLAYVAAVSVAPVSNSSVGTPPPVETVTVSLNTTVMSRVDPALYEPSAELDETEVIVGAAVSTVAVNVLLAVLVLPNASANVPLCTTIDIEVVEFVVGVKVKV